MNDRKTLEACIRLAKKRLEEAENHYDIARADLDDAAARVQEEQRTYEHFQRAYIKASKRRIEGGKVGKKR